MIRVLLADDHELVRDGLARLLSREDDIRVVSEAATGDAALKVLDQREIDVAVLDVSMPGPGIFEILDQTEKHHPECSVLVLSMHPEARYGVRLLRAGAAGYICKERPSTDLVEAIRQVADGHRYITPSMAERLAQQLGDRTEGTHHDLSDREFEVLRLTAGGLSGNEIADQLDVTPQTVSTYRARIRKKLDVETVADMVRYAIENDLAD